MASVIIAALGDARAKARDARRLADIHTIQTALEMYYAENGRYPLSGWVSSFQPAWDTGTLAMVLSPYLPTMPKDPTNVGTLPAYSPGSYTYSYYATGYGGTTTTQQWYMLVVRPEKSFPLRSVRSCDGGNQSYSGTIMTGGDCAQ